MKNQNQPSGKFVIATLLLIVSLIFNLRAKAQVLCEGAYENTVSPAQSPPASCIASYTGTGGKYKNQITFIPKPSDPVITIKLVVHVFTPTNNVAGTWQNTPSYYNGINGLYNLFNRIQNNEERYSLPRLADYSAPGFSSNYISDSKIKYEVVAYYFYSSNQYYYGTANGLPPQTNSTLPNYNPQTINAASMMSYLNSTYPSRLQEGLAVLMSYHGPLQNVYNSPTLGAIPYVAVLHIPGVDQQTMNDNNKFASRQLRHELGHATGLNHTYYGQAVNPAYFGWSCITTTCVPLTGGPSSPHPETNINYNTTTQNGKLDCTNMDYLSDVLLKNNPTCPFQCPPTNTVVTPNPPISTCGSCYERGDTQLGSNNIMSDNAVNQNAGQPYEFGWISPLQMGRRIRALHFVKTSTWYGVGDWGNLRYYAKEMVSGHASPWIVDSNETWDFNIQMYKDIVVKAGKTLKITCTVAMATDGKIIVEKGAKLIIDGGKVTGWCKKTPAGAYYNVPLWTGIEVHGDPNQNQLINNSTGYCPNQGIVEIINQGTVEYAVKGICTSSTTQQGAWVPGTSGGIVLATNSSFINNIYDIILYKYQGGNAVSKAIYCDFKTTGLIGTYTNNLLIVPQEHIKLYDNVGFNIYGCTFEYAAGATYPAAFHGIGLYTTNSSFNVDKFCNQIGCANSVFKNLKMGTYIDNFNPIYTGTIKNCDFIDNDKAMVGENCYNMVFSENTITMTANQTGVYMYKSKYYTLKNNNISGQYWQGAGIVAYDSQDGLHQIYRNTISGLNTGILAVDNNGGYSTGTFGLKMNCNDFNSSATNMFDIGLTPSLSAMPVVMKEQSVFNPGPNAQNIVRNLYGATYMSSLTQNKFYVDGSNNQNIYHASTPAGLDNPNTPNQQASAQVQLLPFTGIFNYSVDCPAVLPSSGGNGNSPAQLLSNMNTYITSLRGNGANGAEIQASVASKIKLFMSDTLHPNLDSVVAIYNSNQGGMNDADVLAVFAYIAKGEYGTANIKTNALGANRADWKSLLQKIIELKQDPMDVYSLLNNPENVSFLQSYANTEGKDGQACAQAILRLVFGTEHTYPITYPTIPAGQNREAHQTVQENNQGLVIVNPNVKVYPNPAQNGITVFNSVGTNEIVKVEVKDLLGRIVYTNFMNKEAKLYIPLSDCGNGVYIVTLSKNKEIIYRSKIMKQN